MFDFFFKKKIFAPKLFKKTKKSFLTILRKNSFFTKSSAFSHHPGDKKTQNPTQLTLKNDKVDVSGQYVPLQPPAELIFACSNQPNSVFTPFSPPNSRLAVKISVLSHETYAGSSSPHHPCGSQVNFTKRKIFFSDSSSRRNAAKSRSTNQKRVRRLVRGTRKTRRCSRCPAKTSQAVSRPRTIPRPQPCTISNAACRSCSVNATLASLRPEAFNAGTSATAPATCCSSIFSGHPGQILGQASTDRGGASTS